MEHDERIFPFEKWKLLKVFIFNLGKVNH
jgi:hypothetical protein